MEDVHRFQRLRTARTQKYHFYYHLYIGIYWDPYLIPPNLEIVPSHLTLKPLHQHAISLPDHQLRPPTQAVRVLVYISYIYIIYIYMEHVPPMAICKKARINATIKCAKGCNMTWIAMTRTNPTTGPTKVQEPRSWIACSGLQLAILENHHNKNHLYHIFIIHLLHPKPLDSTNSHLLLQNPLSTPLHPLLCSSKPSNLPTP